METFSSLDKNKKLSDLDGLKFGQKSMYASDFEEQASSIEEVTGIIQELELNRAQADVTKLLRPILDIHFTFTSCDTVFFFKVCK